MADEADGLADAPKRRRSLIGRIFRSHDFARDIVVTTLGVLIALGIGEIVEEVRWKFRIAANDKAMRAEAGLLHGVYVERDMLGGRSAASALDSRTKSIIDEVERRRP